MANEVEEIKSRLDLVELIGSYVQVKKAGANYKASCPFHQEKTASLMISPEKQIWKCFGCGRGGDHYKFIMETEHLEFGDALRLLAQKAGVTLQPRTRAEYETRDKKETLYAINNLAARVFQTILQEKEGGQIAKKYLLGRGIKSETIKKWWLGYAPRGFDLKNYLVKKGYLATDQVKAGSPDRFYERIMFPIFDVLGNVIGFTGRVLGDIQPKYLNSPETPLYNKSRLLYGLNFAKAAIKQKDYVVLVEGQMDVLALHQAGIQQTVASSGTAITETQIELLSKYTQNFLLAFDNDEAGRTTTKKVIEMLLKKDLNGKVIDFGKFKDAGELFAQDPTAWAQAAKGAKESIEWWLNLEISKTGNLDYLENKKKVIKSMLPLLSLINDETRLDHYAQRLALIVGVKAESVYAAVGKSSSQQTAPDSQKPSPTALHLTNEEQLLALVLTKPELLKDKGKQFNQVVWQSELAVSIAQIIKKLYTDNTLIKNQIQFLNAVKKSINPETVGKVDSWQFWLSQQWPTLTNELASEIIDEKLVAVTTKEYENQKDDLAREIKRAQESGDIKTVKKLMKDLSDLTKEKN